MTAISKIDEDGNYKYKPKRDSNGIIQCQSQLDKEACRYADKVGAYVSRNTILPWYIPTESRK